MTGGMMHNGIHPNPSQTLDRMREHATMAFTCTSLVFQSNKKSLVINTFSSGHFAAGVF